MSAPPPADSPSPKAAARALARQKIAASELFDAAWYARRYPESAGDPVGDFLAKGASDLRDPGPEFSSAYYLQTRPGLVARGVNPLIHALNHRDDPTRGLVPGRVLAACDRLMREGRTELALQLARRDLPPDSRHLIEILKCNQVLERSSDWIRHLNRYLVATGALPLTRRDGGTHLFDGLSCATRWQVTEGPKISVLMAVWNAQKTIGASIRSILAQTWRNLEVIVVDDASTDETSAVLRELCAEDPRLRVLRNARNVGPYASKNRALMLARGEWISGHDSDEWSHPSRFERHMAAILRSDSRPPVSHVGMMRLTADGRFSQLRPVGRDVADGVLQLCPVSALFARQILRDRLGAWDCARYGADTELIERAKIVLGVDPPFYPLCGTLSLDWVGSLTNNPDFGIHPDHGVSPDRAAYRKGYRDWHASAEASHLKLSFPPGPTPFARPGSATVPTADILFNLREIST